MISAILFDNKIVVSCPIEEKETIKCIPGCTWNDKVKAWSFPLNYKVYTTLVKQIPNIKISDDIIKWISHYKRLCNDMLAIKNITDITLPINKELNDKLFSYQRVGSNYMQKYKRIINADDMGLGKTLQSICAIEIVNPKYILIICPNSLKFTWEKEIAKWTNRKSLVIHGNDRNIKAKLINSYEEGYFIINYESFRLFPQLANFNWDITIMDEAHRLKNRKALHVVACKKVKSEYLWLLTGTPIENRPSELWSLLNCLYPKTFSSYWLFVEQYCYIKEITITDASGNERKAMIPDFSICPKELHELINPIMIRRLKTEVLKDLPEKLYQNIIIELAPEERRVYKEIIKDMISMVNEDTIIATPTVLSQYTRLKQICISKELLGENRINIHSAKLDALVELIDSSVETHKIVVFTTLLEALKLVKDRLYRDIGIVALEISGEVKTVDRQRNLELFHNDPNSRVMLVTIQTGGVGLDLTPADICINLDKHPNPMKNIQGEDRLYRIGQKKNVTIYNIIAKDTIEEYMENMLLKKETQFIHVIDGELVFINKYFNTLMQHWNF
jgi:SNF2 family DNA or RNA helicase